MTWIWALLKTKIGKLAVVAAALAVVWLWGNWGWNNYRAEQKKVVALQGTIKGLEAKIKVQESWNKLDREAQGEIKKIESNAKKWLCDYFSRCPVPKPSGVRKVPAVPKTSRLRLTYAC